VVRFDGESEVEVLSKEGCLKRGGDRAKEREMEGQEEAGRGEKRAKGKGERTVHRRPTTSMNRLRGCSSFPNPQFWKKETECNPSSFSR
jgi:hypothetical protein